MEIQALKVVYFSPTGTSKAVANAIARGIGQYPVETIDITKADVRAKPLRTGQTDLLIIAAPVYRGRIPGVLEDWFKSFKADNTPVVCVVLYGNREYDDALLELKNFMVDGGCKTLACAAYIGEHTFSSPDLPTAQGRPDAEDLKHAESFGRGIAQKLQSLASPGDLVDISVPGNFPYGSSTELFDQPFIAINDDCTQCGICAEICPVGAIDPDDAAVTDPVACITCCACIKSCPENAKSIMPGPIKDISIRLNKNLTEPKQPVTFI